MTVLTLWSGLRLGMARDTRLFAVSASAVLAALFLGITLAAQAGQDPQAAPTAKEKLLQSRACVECNLSGVGFEKGTNLRGVDVSGATMVGTILYGVDLTNANFAGADLSKAVLSFADLTNANLANVNLAGANLAAAKGADLSTAKTTDATVCPDGQSGPCR